MDRELRQKAFVRVCRDSGFRLDAVRAAQIAAGVIGCHPLEIWMAMPSWGTAEMIAVGDHPAAQKG